ncbi:MAG: SMC family ATPase [bacterium]
MKPLRLEFCGLHSYCDCDPQDIDFAWLGASGLFGIFGPTGAGKSTILDAMTLALYGNVERASKGTQGIIHQNSEKLWVRFEFELGNERYQVEQRYQRVKDDPHAVINKRSLLCRLNPDTGEYVPYAEKITEVKAAVEKLIGLSEEEFTRAVVLPQGKFDAFLSLKGKDKAAMLENIFNLSCYGQKIYEKASRTKEQAESRRRELEAEARGLGDCSLPVLEARREEQARLARLAQEHKQSLEKLRQEEEGQRRIKEWFEEKTKLEKEKKALEEQEEAMRQTRERTALAERAERCRRDLELLRDLQAAREKEALSLARQQKALEGQQGAHQKEKENYELISRRREENRPGLFERRQTLKSCLESHEQSKEKKKEQARQQAENTRISQELSRLSEDLAAGQQRWQTEQERLEKINREIEHNTVDPVRKHAIQTAYQHLCLLEEKEKVLANELGILNKNLGEHKQAEKQWLAAIQGHLKESLFWSRAGSLPDWQAGGVENLVEAERKGIQEALVHCDQEIDQVKLRSEGAHLALRLKEGTPCPVCGSRQHPAPALSEGLREEMARWEKEKKGWQEQQKKFSQFEVRIAKMAASLAGVSREIERQQKKVTMQQEESQRLSAELREQAPALSRDEIREQYQALAKQESTLALVQERQKKQTLFIEELRRKMEQARQKKAELEIRQSSLQSSLAGLAEGLADLERSIQAITQGRPIRSLIEENETAITSLEKRFQEAQERFQHSEKLVNKLHSDLDTCRGKLESLIENEERAKIALDERLRQEEFPSSEAAHEAMMERGDLARLQQEIRRYQEAVLLNRDRLASVADKLAGQSFDPAAYAVLLERCQTLHQQVETEDRNLAVVSGELEKLEKNHLRWQAIDQEMKALDRRIDQADELARLFRGRALVTFLSHEYLEYMCREASECLRFLTRERYTLRVDQDNNFFMIDSFNGAKERPVSTLSGGETFLTALSLALALSSQVQARGRSQHLGFFFLDEGFGTLDNEKLDLVMNTLERLQSQQDRIVGIISHVGELRERMPRYLEVFPARSDGTGSRIRQGGQ